MILLAGCDLGQHVSRLFYFILNFSFIYLRERERERESKREWRRGAEGERETVLGRLYAQRGARCGA